MVSRDTVGRLSPLEDPVIVPSNTNIPLIDVTTTPTSIIDDPLPVSSGNLPAGTPSSDLSLESPRSDPLGPRWTDYSFRESDLYYHQQPEVEIENEEEAEGAKPWTSVRSLVKDAWQNISRNRASASGTSSGFEVVRRPPPSNMMRPPEARPP